MTTQQAIIDALYTTLSATGAGLVGTLVSGRVYGGAAPQNPTLPMVVITATGDRPLAYFGGLDDPEFTFQVDIQGLYRAGDKATRTIADAAYAQLHRATLTISGYNGASCMCEDRGGAADRDLITGGLSEQDAWRIMQQYRVYASSQ